MGYVFLIVALLSFGGLGVLHKVADRCGCRPASINMFLFLWATIFTSGAWVLTQGLSAVSDIPPRVASIAGICGLFASLAILSFQHGIRYGKISTSWLVINLSTAIPAVLSVCIYREQIGAKRVLSLSMAASALLLLWLDRRKDEGRAAIIALVREPSSD